MRNFLVGCSIALAAVACGTSGGGSGADAHGGGGSNQLDIYQSGSRIKMNVLTTPDGAKAFSGWHDTQLNEDCSFGLASDGMTRCLPAYTNGGTYWADAGCTMPAGLAYSCATTPPKYIGVPSATACFGTPSSEGVAIYATGSAVTTVYVKNGATCAAATISSLYTVYAVSGAALAPSTFQAATLDVE